VVHTSIFLGLGEIRRLNDTLLEHPMFGDPSRFRVLPLHSTVSSEGQGAVFDIPAPGTRKIVIATNIAETGTVPCIRMRMSLSDQCIGITIPDITCVIDTGKHREMRYRYELLEM
jgi:ATP-dependent RNA helicase DHX29